MKNYIVIHGNTVEKSVIEGYELVLGDVSNELSDSEYGHLVDIASIGYEHAVKKDIYIEDLHSAVSEWVFEARRGKLRFTDVSTESDVAMWYNSTGEVIEQMGVNHVRGTIPTFFVCFGAAVLALFCIFATILTIGICQNSFFVNPIYLLMFTVGFLGLLFTDVAAIVEWRKEQNGEG